MQDKYVGDVGDFGKYGLLRRLCNFRNECSGPRFRLGVVWYWAPEEIGTADGRHIAYLENTRSNQKKFESCDPDLYDILRRLTKKRGGRTVAAVESSGALPDARFFSERLSFDEHSSVSERLVQRRDWLTHAGKLVEKSHVVFVDPDNGLEVPSRSLTSRFGPKYCGLEEAANFYASGRRTLIIYQHASHNMPVSELVRSRIAGLQRTMDPASTPIALRFQRGTARVFFIIPSPKHSALISRRISSLLESPWRMHFQLEPLSRQ